MLKLFTLKEGWIHSIAGVFGSIATYAFGGWNGVLEIFFIAIAFDWITGISASLIEGKGISSRVGFKGGLKKFLMILTIYFTHRIDNAFDINWAMTGTIFFWLSNELLSIIENLSRCGMKTPPVFRKILSILQDKSNVDTNQNGEINNLDKSEQNNANEVK